MSVWPVASQTRTPLGTGIIGALPGCRAPPRWWPDQPDPRSAPVLQPTPPRPRRRRPPLVGVASQREKAAQAGQRPDRAGVRRTAPAADVRAATETDGSGGSRAGAPPKRSSSWSAAPRRQWRASPKPPRTGAYWPPPYARQL